VSPFKYIFCVPTVWDNESIEGVCELDVNEV